MGGMGGMLGHSHTLLHVSGFANSSGETQVSLLVGLGKQLKSIEVVLVCFLANSM
jgi:hypothetical protein